MREEEFFALKVGDTMRIALPDIAGLAIVVQSPRSGGLPCRCRALTGARTLRGEVALRYASSANEVVSLTDEEQALVMKYNLGL